MSDRRVKAMPREVWSRSDAVTARVGDWMNLEDRIFGAVPRDQGFRYGIAGRLGSVKRRISRA